MAAVNGAVAELLTEVARLSAGAGEFRAGLARVVAGTEGHADLSLPVLTVALVQGGLLSLGVLLLVVLLPGPSSSPSSPTSPILARASLDAASAAQFLLTELKDSPAGLGHQDLGYGAPVTRETLDQNPDSNMVTCGYSKVTFLSPEQSDLAVHPDLVTRPPS